MKNLVLIAVFLISTVSSAETARFNQAGFSIDILDQEPGSSAAIPLQMYLQPKSGFSANVNVQIQPFQGSLKEYISLSESQFEQMGLKAIKTESEGNTAIFEYKGEMQGSNLHFYSKVFKKGDLFYLATATDLSSEWPKNKDILMSVINSFQPE